MRIFHRHEWQALGEHWILRGDRLAIGIMRKGNQGYHNISVELRHCGKCGQYEYRSPSRVSPEAQIGWTQCGLARMRTLIVLAEEEWGVPKNWKKIPIITLEPITPHTFEPDCTIPFIRAGETVRITIPLNQIKEIK